MLSHSTEWPVFISLVSTTIEELASVNKLGDNDPFNLYKDYGHILITSVLSVCPKSLKFHKSSLYVHAVKLVYSGIYPSSN